MRILGLILAGGASRRFGSDKATALVDGMAMLDHVAARLAPQVDRIAIAGRDWPGLVRIDDRPHIGLGPLGGLCGGLHHALGEGYDAVLTAGCDLPGLPRDLAGRLMPGPAVIAGQPTIGLWPALLAGRLEEHLEVSADDLSIAAWVRTIGAARVPYPAPIANINRPDDLAAFTSADRQSSR